MAGNNLFNAKTYADFVKEYGYKKVSTHKLIRKAHNKYREDVLNYSTASLVYPNVFSIRADVGRVETQRDLGEGLQVFQDFDFDKYINMLNEAKSYRSKTKGRSVVDEIEKMWEKRGE